MTAKYERSFVLLGFVFLAACSGARSTAPEQTTSAPASSTIAFTGVMDEPKDGAVVSGKFSVGGWGYAKGGTLNEIQLLIDGAQTGNPTFHGARPDVAKAFPNDPEAANSGFTTTVDTGPISAGKHMVEVRAKLSDGSVRPFGKAIVTVSK